MSSDTSAATVVRTLAHLRPRQVLHQLVRRAAGPPRSPRSTREEGLEDLLPVGHQVPLAPAPEGAMDGRGRVVLLGQAGHDPRADGWEPGDRDALWLYTLHYHGWILDPRCDPGSGRAVVSDWIEHHTRGTGWHPYPTAMRIFNWTGWLRVHGGRLPRGERDRILESLAAQCRHLARHLEYHIDGNHLWTNLAALSFAALAFEGPLARRLEADHLARFERTVREQLAADGCHMERTPTYHCLLAQQLGLVAGAARARASSRAASLDAAFRRMLAALPAFTHPDGDVALWGDSQLGAPASPSALGRQFGASLPDGDATAPQGGFARRRWGPWTVLWNAGGVGMAHQPGHIHGDALSIELSLGEERVLVDAGVGTYTPGPERAYARSTAAHNTATVGAGDPDQHELWASHRIGARAEPEDLEYRPGRLAGTIQGYRSPAPHRREVERTEAGVRCTDRILGQRAPGTVRYFLPAGIDLEPDGAAWLARTPGGARFRITPHSESRVALSMAPGWHSIARPHPRICLSATVPRDGMSVDFETLL